MFIFFSASTSLRRSPRIPCYAAAPVPKRVPRWVLGPASPCYVLTSFGSHHHVVLWWLVSGTMIRVWIQRSATYISLSSSTSMRYYPLWRFSSVSTNVLLCCLRGKHVRNTSGFSIGTLFVPFWLIDAALYPLFSLPLSVSLCSVPFVLTPVVSLPLLCTLCSHSRCQSPSALYLLFSLPLSVSLCSVPSVLTLTVSLPLLCTFCSHSRCQSPSAL